MQETQIIRGPCLHSEQTRTVLTIPALYSPLSTQGKSKCAVLCDSSLHAALEPMRSVQSSLFYFHHASMANDFLNIVLVLRRHL